MRAARRMGGSRTPAWIAQRITAGTMSYTKQGRVIDLGASGAWDDWMVESACPIWDPESQRWALIYTGYKTSTSLSSLGIAWASSPDGPFTKDAANPILAGSGTAGDPDRYGVTGTIAFFESGSWHVYSIGLDGAGYEGGTPRLCYYTTPSLVTPVWTRHGAIVSPSGAGWRSGKVWIGCIVKRNGTYYVFFNATGTPNARERIGYATASSPAGPWTVDDANSPVLDISASAWDSAFVGQPWVFRIGNTWVMEYYGFAGTSASDGIATTTDAAFPLGWTRYAGNPVLTPAASGIDAKYAHKPLSIITARKLYHFYTAVAADDRRTVALAIASR